MRVYDYFRIKSDRMKLQDIDFRVLSKLEICIEHPITPTFDKLENVDIEVVGNIHENPELLGGGG